MQSLELQQQLYTELLTYISKPQSTAKFTPILLLDLFFFTFVTGLPLATLSHIVYVDSGSVSYQIIDRWLNQIYDDLIP